MKEIRNVKRLILTVVGLVTLFIVILEVMGYFQDMNKSTMESDLHCEELVTGFSENSDTAELKDCFSSLEWYDFESLGNGSMIKHLKSDTSIGLIYLSHGDSRNVLGSGVLFLWGIDSVHDGYLVRGEYFLSDPLPTATAVVETEEPSYEDYVIEVTPDDSSFYENNGLEEAVNTRYYSTECQIYRFVGGPSYYNAEKYDIVPNIIGIEHTPDQSLYCKYPVILVRK